MTTNAVSRPSTAHPDEKTILRYTFAERVNHWLGAVAYTYLLITGLAFWSPYMYWLAAIVGGGPAARFSHPWAGLIFTASLFWTFKEWHGDMKINDADRAGQGNSGLHKKRGRETSPGRSLQLRPKAVLLGDFLRRDSLAALWSCLVVHRNSPLESPVRALCRDSGSCERGAHHDWTVPDSRLHERHS